MYTQLFLSDIIVGYTDDYVQNTLVGKVFKNKIKTQFPPVQKLANSPELIAYSQKPSAISHKPLAIGYSGRIAREKGLEYLIEAIVQLKNKHYAKHTIQLLFAGPYGKDVAGEERYYDEIKDLLEKNKIDHKFLGKLSGKEFAQFYQSLDVLVLPSVNRTEAFGMVQVDAMLLGTPVIASNLPGVRIPVQTTKMGRIVEPKNSTQIAQAMNEIIEHRTQYTSPQLIAHAQEVFDINKVYKFYKKLLDYEK